jgi:predicted DNA-binding transcriptional regulator AlpA
MKHKVLSVGQFAKQAGYSNAQIYRLIKDGIITSTPREILGISSEELKKLAKRKVRWDTRKKT